MSDNIDHLQWEEAFLGDWYAGEQQPHNGLFSAQRPSVQGAQAKYSSQCGLPSIINGTNNDWFYKAMAHYAEEDKAAIQTAASGLSSANALNSPTTANVSVDKPLPASPQPYFEYMFANTSSEDSSKTVISYSGIDDYVDTDPVKRPSPRTSSFETQHQVGDDHQNEDIYMLTDDHTSPPNIDPPTPKYVGTPVVTTDMSAFTQYQFNQAGVPHYVTEAEITGSAVPAISAAVGDQIFDIDEQESLRQEQATYGFFGGCRVEESPTPYHHPLVEQESGYADAREGCEDYPAAWPPMSEEIMRQYPVEKLLNQNHGDDIDIEEISKSEFEEETQAAPCNKLRRVLLIPKSRRRQVDIFKKDIKAMTKAFIARRQGRNKKGLTIDTSLSESSNGSKKRVARNSFDSEASTKASSIDSVQYLCTKRVRTENFVELPTPDAIPANLTTPTDGYAADMETSVEDLSYTKLLTDDNEEPLLWPTDLEAAFNDSAHFTSRAPSFSPITPTPPPERISNHNPLPCPLTPTLHGFYGQFRGLTLADLQPNKSAPPTQLTFGDPSHANSLYTHPTAPLTTHPTLDLPSSLNPLSPLFLTLQHLSTLSTLSASSPIAAQRTPSQERLRREAHHELSAARLEGVPVGTYRYYQGHLTVEEYVSKGLCVCWGACACSVVCSRVGDVVCPCAEHIQMVKE